MQVKITLDQERELRFDGMALANLERGTNTSIMRILSRFGVGDIPFHFVLCMLHAALQHELPGRTEEQILRLVERNVSGGTTFEKVMGLSMKCAEALAQALPKGDRKNSQTPEHNPGDAGTGIATNDSVTASASSPANSGG